jgi:hypothetical protein
VSTLRVNNINDASGGTSNLNIPGTAKAWVNFNGTNTVAIRASLNVSSITDNGTGDYTVNFTTAMVDDNYAANVFSNFAGGSGGISVAHQANTFVRSTTQFRFQISDANAYVTTRDQFHIYVSVFR